MKKATIVTLALVMCLSLIPIPASAATGVTVILDGEVMSFEVEPRIMNGRTMVPLRAIFEAMGATIEWDGVTQTVRATKGSTVVVLVIGDTRPTVNGEVVAIDQPGVIVNGRTLAPLRFVAEAFGGTVEWDGGTQTATITSAAAPTPEPTPNGGRTMSAEENKLLGGWSNFNASARYDTSTGHFVEIWGVGSVLEFKPDGTYHLLAFSTSSPAFYIALKGEWRAENGIIYNTNVMVSRSNDGKTWSDWVLSTAPEAPQKYELTTDEYGDLLLITNTHDDGTTSTSRFRR